MITIRPDWPVPENITAAVTTRYGGQSKGCFAKLNIAQHVGDDLVAVERNRRLLQDELPADTAIQWLNQVHGSTVVCADTSGAVPDADASWTSLSGVACAVMTADCLPVLFYSSVGEKIAAAHAGWRGLHAGILEATVAAMGGASNHVVAWLGPAIGPTAFEVGAEVKEQFLSAAPTSQRDGISLCFTASPTRPGFYLADLYQLARVRLAAIGVEHVYGGDWCTYTDREHFYSFRRDGKTGRMVTLIAKTTT